MRRDAGTVPGEVLAKLLVATDGSPSGERATAFAIALGLRFGSELEFCSAVDHAAAYAECCSTDGAGALILPLIRDLDGIASSSLARARGKAGAAGLLASSTLLDGAPVGAIIDCENGHVFDAIVIGTERKHGLERLFLGSMVDGVLRRAEVPVFVAPLARGTAGDAFDRALVAIDGSDASDAAAAFAIAFAAEAGSELIFCSIAEPSHLMDNATTLVDQPERMQADLLVSASALLTRHVEAARVLGVSCDTVVAEGIPAAELLRLADRQHADCIIAGTHGRRGTRRWIIGSVAEDLVRRSPMPLAIVRSSAPHDRV